MICIDFINIRNTDRKAVDMLMAKCKEKANALKEYLKGRISVEF